MDNEDKVVKGGRRPGAGRPKGSTNGIKISDLKQAIIDECGIPFETMIARTANKLYKDFWQDIEKDNWIRFSNNMAKYVIQIPTQEIKVKTSTDSDGDLDEQIKTFLKTSNWVSKKKDND
jgi:hypothetical protein